MSLLFTLINNKRKTGGLTTLFKRFPQGTVLKRRGRTINVTKCKGRQLSKILKDGDVVEAVYTPPTKTRRMWNGVKKSSDPCMITLDTAEPRARMPCGHAITPQALYDYCWYELEKGNSNITCPYVTNIAGETCGYKWESGQIKLSAAMSKEERLTFHIKFEQNRIKQQEIESKNVYPDDVMISLLHNSPKVKVPWRTTKVLKCRACPKCWSIIEYMGGCLTMKCGYPSCGFRFCFRCLYEYGLMLNHEHCLPAPLQFSSDS